jgi:microcompartment protein CcmL/EutN
MSIEWLVLPAPFMVLPMRLYEALLVLYLHVADSSVVIASVTFFVLNKAPELGLVTVIIGADVSYVNATVEVRVFSALSVATTVKPVVPAVMPESV